MSDANTSPSWLKIIGTGALTVLLWVLAFPMCVTFLALIAVMLIFIMVVSFITQAACCALEALCYLIVILVIGAVLYAGYSAVHWCLDRDYPFEKIEEVK